MLTTTVKTIKKNFPFLLGILVLVIFALGVREAVELTVNLTEQLLNRLP